MKPTAKPLDPGILRYTNSGWKEDDIQRFETMLKTVLLPHIDRHWGGTRENGQFGWGTLTHSNLGKPDQSKPHKPASTAK